MQLFRLLSIEQTSVDRLEVKCLPKFCLGQFLSKEAEVRIFVKQIRHSPLPTALLRFDAPFLQTHMQDPFAHAKLH